MLKKLNQYRRKLLQGLASGGEPVKGDKSTFSRDAIKTILVCRPNHRLGNMLLTTPLIQELEHVFPNAKTDLFVKGSVAVPIFENYKSVRKIYILPKKHFSQLFTYIGKWLGLSVRKYDLVINISKSSSSGKLSARIANARFKILGDVEGFDFADDSERLHFAKYPVLNLRHFLQYMGQDMNNSPIPPMSIKLSENELANGKDLLNSLPGMSGKPVISIFTYATGSKRFDTHWWQDSYRELLQRYPGYDIIEILPVENVSQINFAAPSFYSKDIREIAAVIANTSLFIGADSGMMHLAVASGCTVLGLFSTTDAHLYGPYANNSVALDAATAPKEELFKTVGRLLQG